VLTEPGPSHEIAVRWSPVLYLIIVATAVFVSGAWLLANAAMLRAMRKLGMTPILGHAWRAATMAGILIGGALYLGSLLGLPLSWIGGLALVTVVVHGARVGHALAVARSFFATIDDACRDRTDAKITTLLSLRSPPNRAQAYAVWVSYILIAARRAHDLGETERAVRWLGEIDPRRVRYDHGLVLVLARASFAFSLGRRDDARAALAYLPPDLKFPALEEPLAILRALLAVLDGDASDPRLEQVTSSAARSTDQNMIDGWAGVEAHLRAARGDVEGATEILRAMLERGAQQAVERMARHGGPASPLVARVLDAAPYR
jgi:hypothetical protein